MKLSRKKRFSKPSVIKQKPAQANYFHRKENHLKPLLLQPKINLKRVSDFYSNSRQNKRLSSRILLPKSNRSKQIVASQQKKWWIHLWSGLVLDNEAKHKQAIRQAIWLYLYFLLVANRESGVIYRKLSTIARETGFNPRSIQRWLQTLREKGYIKTSSTGRYLEISITKWKSISKRNKAKYQSNNEQTGANYSNNS